MAEPKNKQLSETLNPLRGQKQSNESEAAVMACNDWLRMGAGRSLRELVNAYQQTATIKRGFKPPTLSYETLRTWASRFDWAERATQYDSDFEAIKNEERYQVFNEALALDFGRVRKLVHLANFLEAQLYEQSEPDDDGIAHFLNIWVHDVKSVGAGDNAERVDIERFNSALIEQYRATLADIAKEVGGRVAKQEISGKDGGAIETTVIIKTGMSLDDL
jgi:hypothetical protein